MKLIPTTAAAPITDWPAYVHSCQRHAQCEPKYAAPLPGVPYLQVYVDFGAYEPLAFEVWLQDACVPGHTEQLFPSNYIAGRTPEGGWYGVFKYFDAPFTAVTDFVVWLLAVQDTPAGPVEATWFSELLSVEVCQPLTKIKSCHPETATTTGFDVNGLYYGLPVNEDQLGYDGVRYFHVAWVRKGKVRETSNKATFTSNFVRNFRTSLERTWLLQTELVPRWYKDVLLAIYLRGAVQVDDGMTYLVSDLAFEPINDDDLTWKPYAQLKATTRLYFGCDASECVECCSPQVISATAVGGFGPPQTFFIIDHNDDPLIDADNSNLVYQ